jgi:hypothetical protein
MESRKKTTLAYWIFTLLFAVPFGIMGTTYLAGVPMVAEGMARLGYPPYFAKILGVAKLLGFLAVVTGKFSIIKEWAYAGFTFTLIGACFSHLASGEGDKAITPLLFMIPMVVSYILWKKRLRENNVNIVKG